jgi:hypothetical protein
MRVGHAINGKRGVLFDSIRGFRRRGVVAGFAGGGVEYQRVAEVGDVVVGGLVAA